MIKKVLIVGGGFAGLKIAKKLSKKKEFEVILLDKNNYHFFPPLLYQVGTAFIESSNISYPFRKMFHNQQIEFKMGSLLSIDQTGRNAVSDCGIISYDLLILAMGTETNFFGNDQLKEHTFPLKTIDDAIEMRNHILLKMEEAVRTDNPQERAKLTNIVIAGGGPTGVELAGMLAEMGRNITTKDYPTLDPHQGNIFLIDAQHTLLAPMSVKSQREAIRVLKNLGVNIMLGELVKSYDGENVILANDAIIPSKTLIWASGVIARYVPGLPESSYGPGRRILVNEINLVEGTENIYCLGDQCIQMHDPEFPKGHPQVAQVALQQASQLYKNICQENHGSQTKAFKYFNKGSMAIIAKFHAVVDMRKAFMKGPLAWLTWLFIHIIPIAGYRNKAKLTFNWLWSFLTNDPTLRLIIRPKKEDRN